MVTYRRYLALWLSRQEIEELFEDTITELFCKDIRSRTGDKDTPRYLFSLNQGGEH